MKVETLKDLEAVLKLCRKMSVLDITIDNVHCQLGQVPDKVTVSQNETTPTVDHITEEDVMFWSSGGING